jgi:hypothetical protein
MHSKSALLQQQFLPVRVQQQFWVFSWYALERNYISSLWER